MLSLQLLLTNTIGVNKVISFQKLSDVSGASCIMNIHSNYTYNYRDGKA